MTSPIVIPKLPNGKQAQITAYANMPLGLALVDENGILRIGNGTTTGGLRYALLSEVTAAASGVNSDVANAIAAAKTNAENAAKAYTNSKATSERAAIKTLYDAAIATAKTGAENTAKAYTDSKATSERAAIKTLYDAAIATAKSATLSQAATEANAANNTLKTTITNEYNAAIAAAKVRFSYNWVPTSIIYGGES